MYNEEIKVKFVKEYTNCISTAKKCKAIFNECAKFEESWDADICTQPLEVVQPIIDDMAGLRVVSSWAKLGALKAYGKWCLENHIPGACDGLLKANFDSLDIVKKRMVTNPTHFQRCLDEIFTPEEDETVDNIYRCFYWLAYGGISKEDILKVKCKDVDFENMVVHWDEDIPIYREAIPAFRKSVSLTQFNYNHPLYGQLIKRDRALGDTLIRGLTSDTSVDKITAIIGGYSIRARREGRTTMQLSYYRAWLSGLFYSMHERELAGFGVDFTPAAEKYMAGKVYKLDSGRNTVDAKKRKVINEYKEDYERWKLAFSM